MQMNSFEYLHQYEKFFALQVRRPNSYEWNVMSCLPNEKRVRERYNHACIEYPEADLRLVLCGPPPKYIERAVLEYKTGAR